MAESSGGRRRASRRGLTLTELLIAGTILTLLAAGMGTLVMTVHATNEYCRGQAVAAQHARVALDRIERAVHGAQASQDFPGCLVIAETIGGYEFPDTLVVWSPTGGAVAPGGMPRVNELAIYYPDGSLPNRLIELRAPTNTSICPPANDDAAWATLVSSLKSNANSETVELTNRIRTASVNGGSVRGCVRFETLMTPSAAQWSQYKAATLAWKDIAWPLDYYSTQTGMRRVVTQTEIQIVPGDTNSAQTAIPFFGSATLTYELSR